MDWTRILVTLLVIVATVAALMGRWAMASALGVMALLNIEVTKP